MIHLITFCDSQMSIAAQMCVRSALQHGADVATCERATNWLSLTVQAQRGLGYWAWKPQIIDEMMTKYVKNGDTLIYSDAGVEFVDNLRYIVDRMDQDIFLFGNHWPHHSWCKGDIIDEIMRAPHTEWTDGAPWSIFGKQCQASVIFFRVSDWSRKFVKEWLSWCQFEGGRLVDDSPSRAPNHPEFQENRHDQAILTTMAYRDGIKLHWWPARYDGGFDYQKDPEYQTDDYPILFRHHRLRNHEFGHHLTERAVTA